MRGLPGARGEHVWNRTDSGCVTRSDPISASRTASRFGFCQPFDLVAFERTQRRSTSSNPAPVLRCRSMTTWSEWSNGQVLAPVEADCWALDTDDVLRWLDSAAGTDVRLPGCLTQFAVDVWLPLPATCSDCWADVLASADIKSEAQRQTAVQRAAEPKDGVMTLRFIVGRILAGSDRAGRTRRGAPELVDALHDALDVATPTSSNGRVCMRLGLPVPGRRRLGTFRGAERQMGAGRDRGCPLLQEPHNADADAGRGSVPTCAIPR